MSALLAVISFCVSERCAFFAAKELANTEEQCVRQLQAMQRSLNETFGADKITSVGGCVKVPLKFI